MYVCKYVCTYMTVSMYVSLFESMLVCTHEYNKHVLNPLYVITYNYLYNRRLQPLKRLELSSTASYR